MLIRPRRPRTAEWIRGILALQLAMGAWLVVHDLAATLPRLFSGTSQPRLTLPVTPGDQTRRFDPARIPAFTAPPGTRSFPQTDDMPARLQFRDVAPGEVLMTGDIAEGDAARFFDWLAANEAPVKLWLHSPGGSVGDALAIGRRLRDEGIATAVAAGDVCFSACPYILAGGVLRSADAQAHVGVHQHYFGENIALPAFMLVSDVQAGQAQVVRHLADMGIDLRLLEPLLATPPDAIYVLTPQELERYRLTTGSVPP